MEIKPEHPDKKGKTVITTHVNADFDAMASMLAAQKLYPEAIVVFPGSQEKNLRDFFIQSMVYLFNMKSLKEVDLSEIDRLVLVDTRQPGRIGKFAELLEKPNLEVHIYDHHPAMDQDIKGHYEVIHRTGATVTILAQILDERGIDISPEEATIMCLGIYEDTGSFTFVSTTEQDFRAAALLLSKGANLNTVSDMTSREINPEQVGLLSEMIQAATDYHISGVKIVVTTLTTEDYVPDFAYLVHKMVKMQNLDAIFAIACMGSKIYIVARSRIPEVDAGAIMTLLGGGGHASAASATIKGETLAQTEHRLLDIITKQVKEGRQAKDLMSSPAITVGAEVSCRDAAGLLTRYNINALVVVETAAEKDALLGFITRQIIEKALFHKLDQVPVREYMNTEIESVGPDSDLAEMQDKIMGNKQRILPVIDRGRIAGVVTRTDLLNTLAPRPRRTGADDPSPASIGVQARTRNIVRFLRERLSKRLFSMLKTVGRVADDMGCGAYVVGGFIRDLFLFRPNEDMDIVIEGDGIAFARKFAQLAGARVHPHEKFGTAVIIYPDGFKIDVASARLEHYKAPAALPEVEMGSIKLDLFRRDFTVNTLCVQLNQAKFGVLIDFFSGLKDIKERAIRVLHNLSFVEDPTRAFRAIRFEQRFGFTIGKLTSGLIENAVKMDFFKQLSGRRVFAELRQILEEENPNRAIARLQDYQLLTVIHPSLELNEEIIANIDSVKKVLSWHDLLFLEESYMRWTVYFLSLIEPADRKISEEICLRLELAPRLRNLFCKERFEAERCLRWLERNSPVANGTLYRNLSGFKTELILYMMAATREENIKKAISTYFTRLRQVKISVTGKDLQNMGFKPGPIYREILEAVHEARLNGALKTRNDELVFLKNYVS